MPTFKPRSRTRLKWPLLAVVAVAVIWYFQLHHAVGQRLFPRTQNRVYPQAHPLTSTTNKYTLSRYIYPPIEDAALLKELGSENLVVQAKVRDAEFIEFERTLLLSHNVNDDPDVKAQMEKEKEENELSDLLRAKNNFKNHDKWVHRPSNGEYPEVVVVTAIDFDQYLMDLLIKIVQNRVDYAHAQSYGLYVLWYQTFLPRLNALTYLSDRQKRKWVRIYCLQAAMHAFPGLKWFWYLDEQGFIMDDTVDMALYMLNPQLLEPIMKREQPIMLPLGVIKTYKNTKGSLVNLIVTQLKEKIETHSFVVQNNPLGRLVVQQWGDPLYLNYQNFPAGPDLALTHILQWHPFVLLKLAIVPTRTISSSHVDSNPDDTQNYHEGDFVVQWADIEDRAKSEQVLNFYAKKKAGEATPK